MGRSEPMVDHQVALSHSYQIGVPTREKILELQAAIEAQPDAIGDLEAEEKFNQHHFAPGVYGRTMIIPKGMVVVGKIHKHAHLNVITRGVIKVVTEFGEDTYTGPKTFVSKPGTKRAVYAIEETEWITIHANPDNLTNIRELEEQIIAPSFADYDRLRIEQGDIL